ncbi:MAG: peptidoglycan DD-metalloendopeptidase family protein [Alphaproteobacteria bacterium]|nr:peptidoglycan DD-metalloendopeptidase family protein [Alphaproteobacteria bacterium]
MTIKKKLSSTVRKVKISRFRTYKKLGFLGHRHTVDKMAKSAFCILLGLTTLSLFYLPPSENVNPISSVIETTQTPQPPQPIPLNTDTIHEDLGDDPVQSDTDNLLIELEKLVVKGSLNMTSYMLEKGEALSTLLKRANIDKDAHAPIIDGFSLLINLHSLQPSMTFMVFTELNGNFKGISLQNKNGEVVAVIKEDEGIYTPLSHEGRVEIKNIRITGSIERTFSGSAEKAGLPKALIAQITNALDGEVDFSTFREGDTFDVIFEQKTTAGGLELGEKKILYIGLNIGKKQIHRYAWTDNSGTELFFNPNGQSAEKELLKRPIKGRPRTSSPYGWRNHPVLMARIFHSGVDLAIAQGTPIVAGGDGVITQLGRKGAYGKYIRIRHSNGYQTAYGHMNGYKSGLKVGSKVKRGDVIGYIGQTGRATGPHLHYEVWKDGKTVNPFGNYVLIAKQLKEDNLEKFQKYAEIIHPDFKKHLIGTMAPVPPHKPVFDTQLSSQSTQK